MKLRVICLLSIFSILSLQSANADDLKNTIQLNLHVSGGSDDNFYCTVVDKSVNTVKMQNHSVKIDGFSNDGTATFSGSVGMLRLNHVYFRAYTTGSSANDIVANVGITYDGNKTGLQCSHGTADRYLKY